MIQEQRDCESFQETTAMKRKRRSNLLTADDRFSKSSFDAHVHTAGGAGAALRSDGSVCSVPPSDSDQLEQDERDSRPGPRKLCRSAPAHNPPPRETLPTFRLGDVQLETRRLDFEMEKFTKEIELQRLQLSEQAKRQDTDAKRLDLKIEMQQEQFGMLMQLFMKDSKEKAEANEIRKQKMEMERDMMNQKMELERERMKHYLRESDERRKEFEITMKLKMKKLELMMQRREKK